MRKNWINMAAMMALAFGLWVPGAQSQGTHPTRDFMRQKLTYTQGIVEGVVTEKYGMVVTNAMALRNMNLTNAFLALKNPYYLDRMTNFQSKVDDLIKTAKEKNLDKATENYSEVVSSCVACHRLFRRDQFQNQAKQD